MSVQLYNDTASIKLVRGSDVYNIDRSCDLRVYGQQLHITSNSGKTYHVVEFSEVTVPVVANIEALRVAVEAWKESTFSATIDTTVLATSANQTNGDQKTKITDGAGVVNTKQLGTQLTTNDIGLITNTTIHGLSSQGGGTFVDVKVEPSGKLLVKDDDVLAELENISASGASKATFQEQYNQTDLLNLILLELQEQTRILKKIYQ